MHIWNIKKLREKLKKKELTQKELFIYINLSLLVYFLGGFNITLIKISFLENIFYFLTIFIPIFIFYKTTGKEYFIERYFSLSLVIGLRQTIFVLIPGSILLGILLGVTKNEIFKSLWIYFLLEIPYFYYLYKELRSTK